MVARFDILTHADDNIFLFYKCLDSLKGLRFYLGITENSAKNEK